MGSKYSDLAAETTPQEQPEESANAPMHPRTNAPKVTRKDLPTNGFSLNETFIRGVIESNLYDEQRSGNYKVSGAEKERIEDMVTALKRRGYTRLTLNMALRIALVIMVQDFEDSDEKSMIAQVLHTRFPSYRD